MLSTTNVGFPGMCLPQYRASVRAYASNAPPAVSPTTILTVFPLNASSDAASAKLRLKARTANPVTEHQILQHILDSPLSSQGATCFAATAFGCLPYPRDSRQK